MNNIGFLIMEIAKKLKYRLNQALVEQDVTVQQWAVIQQLAQREMSVTMLATELDIDKPTISGIIKRLAKKSLIEEKDNPTDSRSKLFFLSEMGRKKEHNCRQISDVVLAEFINQLDLNDQETLQHILMKIRN